MNLNNPTMNKYTYYAEEKMLKELPTMEKPVYRERMIENFGFAERVKKYEKHLASLRSYTLSEKVDWPDGKIVEEGKDFAFEDNFAKGNYNNTCAICKKEFSKSDKLWFLCPEHSIVAVPTEQPEKRETGEYRISGLNRSNDGIYATCRLSKEDWFHAHFSKDRFPIKRQYELFNYFKNGDDNVWKDNKGFTAVVEYDHLTEGTPINPIIIEIKNLN